MVPSAAPPSPAPTTEDVFSLLEYVLANARLRLRTEGKPIVFDIVPGGDVWLFDPRADGPMFRRMKDPAPEALRIRCGADLLARLVTDESFALGDDDTASFDGNLDDLLILADVLEESKNVLGIRTARTAQ